MISGSGVGVDAELLERLLQALDVQRLDVVIAIHTQGGGRPKPALHDVELDVVVERTPTSIDGEFELDLGPRFGENLTPELRALLVSEEHPENAELAAANDAAERAAQNAESRMCAVTCTKGE